MHAGICMRAKEAETGERTVLACDKGFVPRSSFLQQERHYVGAFVCRFAGPRKAYRFRLISSYLGDCISASCRNAVKYHTVEGEFWW